MANVAIQVVYGSALFYSLQTAVGQSLAVDDTGAYGVNGSTVAFTVVKS